MTYRYVDMSNVIRLMLNTIMSIRSGNSYEIGNVSQKLPGLAMVTLNWPRERWYICLSINLALEYADSIIRDRIERSEYDEEWLSRFDTVEAAMDDYKRNFRGDNKHLIENVWDAHTCSTRTAENPLTGDGMIAWQVSYDWKSTDWWVKA